MSSKMRRLLKLMHTQKGCPVQGINAGQAQRRVDKIQTSAASVPCTTEASNYAEILWIILMADEREPISVSVAYP